MIQTKPKSEIKRTCSRHPERLAAALRISRVKPPKLPPQTIYRPECAECGAKPAKAGESIKLL